MNGWQRLFCILIVFLYLPISLTFFPTNPWLPLPTSREVLKIIPTDILLLMKEGKVELSIAEFFQQPNIANEKIDWNKYLEGEKSKFTKYQINEDKFVSGKIEVTISNELNKEKHEQIIDDLYSSLTKDYKNKLRWEQLEFLAMVVAFPVFIYVLGLAIGWVYRGFRNGSSK